MYRRLYFLLPDVENTMCTVGELMDSKIEIRLHVKAGVGIDRSSLPGKLQDIHKDTEHIVESIIWDINLTVFFLGLPVIVLAVIMSWNTFTMMMLAIIVTSLVIGFIKTILPDVKLSDFDDALSHKNILLMIDTKRGNVKPIEDIMRELHPEAVVGGVGWQLGSVIQEYYYSPKTRRYTDYDNRTTTDPITGCEVHNPENHPCVYEGSGDDGLEIYFENEENRQAYLHMEREGNIVLQGNDSDDYVAES